MSPATSFNKYQYSAIFPSYPSSQLLVCCVLVYWKADLTYPIISPLNACLFLLDKPPSFKQNCDTITLDKINNILNAI